MIDTVSIGGLQVSRPLHDLVANEILPALETLEPESLWANFNAIIVEMATENRSLLKHRDDLQQQIDTWHSNHRDKKFNAQKYRQLLIDIGYLLPEPDSFEIETSNVDDEIKLLAGPQLVVPINNARYALNAANARWGSLYDAFYGTDVIPGEKHNKTQTVVGFDIKRGKKVIALALDFLDKTIPLGNASYRDISRFSLLDSTEDHLVENVAENALHFEVQLNNGTYTSLTDATQFVGYRNEDDTLSLLFVNHGLHIELQINPRHSIGKLHSSGIKDIILESALTTILDFEDSITAVDAEDKTLAYRHLLGLMRGDLEAHFFKQGKEIKRHLNSDRQYISSQRRPITQPGKSLMLVRNVGLLMTTDAVLTATGEEIPEGILDTFITALIGLYDLKKPGRYQNSRCNSIYIVKPKLHGPEEVAFCCKLFSRVEDALSLPRNTLKLGIMDEERRTTVNLKACIAIAKQRIIFINTGFLDRTGDEIHTSMQAGAFLPKAEIKKQPWINAYEDWNVDIGLICGFQGNAQIGKGMWAMPDLMKQMLDEKIIHPKSGANCAWVPSPTAATLHAMHYHQVNVIQQQQKIKSRPRASLDDILTIPLLGKKTLTPEEIQQELDNNAQGILGYVVRWIDQGIGCSTVPDIHQLGLMEDRATLRISSQHIANWLLHKICSEEQVITTFKRMANIVDEQNKDDRQYLNLSPDFTGIAFQAALDLVFKGRIQPNGYTEPLLHTYRRKFKHSQSIAQQPGASHE